MWGGERTSALDGPIAARRTTAGGRIGDGFLPGSGESLCFWSRNGTPVEGILKGRGRHDPGW